MPLTDNIRPEPNPPLTVERVELARAMYVEGFTVARICSHCLISLGTLYTCLDGTPFGPDGLRWDPIPRRRNNLGKRSRALRADPASLRNRLIRTLERQVRDIETRLAQPDLPGPERERDVRMMMSVTRALRDLAFMESGGRGKGRGAVTAAEEPPRDIAQLRRDLAKRIHRIVQERQARQQAGAAMEPGTAS